MQFCSIRTPLTPPLHQMATNDMKMGWNYDKIRTILNTIVKYRLSYMALAFSICELTAFEIQTGNYTPTPHPKRTWLITTSWKGDPGIFQIGGRRWLKTSKYCNCFKPLFSPFWTCCYIFLFCVAKFIRDEMQIWKRILHILEKFQTSRSFTVSYLFLLYSF